MQDTLGQSMSDDLTLTAQRRKKKTRVRVQENHDSGVRGGLVFARRWTTAGVDPFSEVEWQLRSAVITGEKGQVVFEQHPVEVPAFWSQLATNVVVSKYFRGAVGTPEREHSVRQLIGRVVSTITAWGEAGHYFASEADAEAFKAELTFLCLHQHMSFNSPVWFNLGVEGERPQASACFINAVEDTMESILDLAKTEGMLFKYGSGAGTNLSILRGSKERLAGGGIASGPLSFMKGFDAFAGAIKSGGKTRRAAKMVILDVDHPDVVQFINSKSNEEKKAWALIEAGYDAAVDGEAYGSVYFQNANHSVRLTDEFMKAVENDGVWKTLNRRDGSVAGSYEARDLMRQIAAAAHLCGDPGLQFDTTINTWHTCKGTDRIYASNPCVTGDTLVATSTGLVRIDTLLQAAFEAVGADGELHSVKPAFKTGVKPVYRLQTRAGFELKLTADHKVLTRNRGDVPACELTKDDVLVLGRSALGNAKLDPRLAEFLGLMVGDGCLMGEQETAMLALSPDEDAVARRVHDNLMSFKREHAADGRAARDVEVTKPQGTLRLGTSARCVVDELVRYAVLDEGSENKAFTAAIFSLDREALVAVLRGLFTADGTVANYGDKSQYVSLDSTSLVLLQQTQLLLLAFGIKAKLYRNRRVLGQTTALLSNGKGGRLEYPIRQMHSLRVSRSSRLEFAKEVGFLPESDKAAKLAQLNQETGAYADPLVDEVESLTFLGEEAVYDLTEPVTHHFVASGLVVHNCSEYMFLNDTACNLASLNLMKFRDSRGEFDAEGFKHGVDVTLSAMEIVVGSAAYPTPKIEKNSHEYRPLGLGYANLGALLMARGLAYDSDAGRAYAGAITALMTGEAYAQSARMAEVKGAFAGYARNAESMLGVITMHRDAVNEIDSGHVPPALYEAARGSWDDALSMGREHGYRNAQASVLAPTGTIAFMMDCDTTGIEPDISLIKYKKLVGGGLLKIVNTTVPEALERLGYVNGEKAAILEHLEKEETIEGAPYLKPEHLSVFDCAFKPLKGKRTISPMGHVRMMAAAQPFLSGAISKTVNLPEEATPEDIQDTYVQAWRMGLKAVAIYRDNCKRSQPLNTSLKTVEAKSAAPRRRRLPDERQAFTHKFSIAGHEGYITVGLYEDGMPGEVFITMSKEGSTISGLMDSLATSISLALQYGVPLPVLVEKFSHTRYEPSGFTGNKEIPIAKSITDYIFRWLAYKFLRSEPKPAPNDLSSKVSEPKSKSAGEAMESREKAVFLAQADAPSCADCGSIMVRNGACYKCTNCGSTSGCS